MTVARDVAVLPMAELMAPSDWRVVEIIADLHLQPSQPDTLALWQRYLDNSTASAIFILGDLFEVWVGDDVLDEAANFESECVAILRMAAARRPVFFMPGNRDFLTGPQFLARSGMIGMADPCVLVWGARRILMSHGDALCLDDVPYQQFRALSRSPQWQQQILAQPLAARRALGRSIRSESEQRKQSGTPYADADPVMTARWMRQARADWLIHGHTHQPADHPLPDGSMRIVLSDWHLDAYTHRAEVVRMTPQCWQRIAL